MDIYAAAGLQHPEISIIDDEFARKAINDKHPNLQIELLRRLLSPATLDDHEGDTVGEHEFVNMLSPLSSLLAP
jgi:hypothetical protein